MPNSTRTTCRLSWRARAAAWCAGLGRAGTGGHRYLLALLLACAACEVAAQPAPAPVSLEYAVKATYLYKLAPFVNWPPTAFTAPDAPFRICVAGDDPFDDYLTNAVVGRRLGTHPFEVHRLAVLTPEAGCQIAFIGRMHSQSINQALDAVNGTPVLTVVDSGAAQQGGIVQFVIDRGRVRFVIDTQAAARNHITISSKLLNLAMAPGDAT
jgi:hypothetical protein